MRVLIAVVFALLFNFSVFAQTQAEVIVPKTFIRKAPNPTAEIVQTVQQGDKLIFEKSAEEFSGWTYVSVQGGKIKGWVSANTIRSLVNTGGVTPSPTVNPADNSPTSPTVSPTVTPTPMEDDEVVRVDTAEVSLNVRVVDDNNRPVKRLAESEFEVYEDDVLQPITAFVTTEVPIVNALVIDNSRSLRTQLEKVIEAGKIMVGSNRPKDESAIIRFVSADKIEVVRDFTTNYKSLEGALDNLYVEGGQTAIIDAVYQTAKKVDQYQNTKKTEDVKLRAVILVSDGDDRSSSHSEKELFELLRRASVQIYTIGFTNALSSTPDSSGVNRQEKARAFLTRLAQETGGKVYFPESVNDLLKIAADISGELRTQYLISYSPTNENRDGGFRKIKVVVKDSTGKEKRNAITRTGRTASKN